MNQITSLTLRDPWDYVLKGSGFLRYPYIQILHIWKKKKKKIPRPPKVPHFSLSVESFTEMNRESRVFIRFPSFLNQITPIALLYPKKGAWPGGGELEKGLFMKNGQKRQFLYVYFLGFFFNYFFIKAKALPHNLV